MSTTVTYEGSTIATVENNTKTLQTKGKYLTDDITLTDTSQSGEDREDLTIPKDVDFIDYDGRLLYSYTADEFLALTELPPNPTNSGLIAQGWNWTLADAKEYVQKWGCLVVGQSYTTDDGRTRVYVTVKPEYIPIKVNYQLTLVSDEGNSATINVYWGDGTSSLNQTIAANYKPIYLPKYYSEPGEYMVEIEVVSGKVILGYAWSNFCIIGNNGSQGGAWLNLSANSVKRVEIGDNVKHLGAQPFNSQSLESVTIPTTVESFVEQANTKTAFLGHLFKGVVFPEGFQGRYYSMFLYSMPSLKYVALPKSATSFQIANAANIRKLTLYSFENAQSAALPVKLGYCRELTHLVVPGTYTTLPQGMADGSMIKKFTIPETVTIIQNEALIYSGHLKELHVLPTTPPTLNNVRALNGFASDCVIYVPYSEDHSILEAYQSATNWSTFASYMQEEPHD